MNLKECRETYYEYSKKASEVVRQFGLAGLAFIWILKEDTQGKIIVPADSIPAGFLIIVSLGFDLLHCIIPTAIWGILARRKEIQGFQNEDDFKVPIILNWPANFCFWGKIITMLWAYYILLSFVFSKLEL